MNLGGSNQFAYRYFKLKIKNRSRTATQYVVTEPIYLFLSSCTFHHMQPNSYSSCAYCRQQEWLSFRAFIGLNSTLLLFRLVDLLRICCTACCSKIGSLQQIHNKLYKKNCKKDSEATENTQRLDNVEMLHSLYDLKNGGTWTLKICFSVRYRAKYSASGVASVERLPNIILMTLF